MTSSWSSSRTPRSCLALRCPALLVPFPAVCSVRSRHPVGHCSRNCREKKTSTQKCERDIRERERETKTLGCTVARSLIWTQYSANFSKRRRLAGLCKGAEEMRGSLLCCYVRAFVSFVVVVILEHLKPTSCSNAFFVHRPSSSDIAVDAAETAARCFIFDVRSCT